MSYSKVLKSIIANTNITQEELSNKCKELKAPISRGQINKIVNGKAPAPEEKVSRAIAKVCNVDDRELVIEGYLEKAPREFIDFIKVFQELLLKIFLPSIEPIINEDEMELFKEAFEKETMAKIVLGILEMEKSEYDTNIFNIERNEDEIKATIKKLLYITMEDESMEVKIPKGSKMQIEIKEKYKNGDIVLIKVKENKKPIIRVIFFIGRDICLYPLNNKYNSLYLRNSEYQILGVVSSVEIKI